jgi:hypothetical protein
MVSFFARLIALALVSVNRKQSEESDHRKFWAPKLDKWQNL